MHVGKGCSSGSNQSFRESACLPCRKAGRAAGRGNGEKKKHNKKYTPKSNAQKKANREAELREEQQRVLGTDLDAEITDEQAKEIVMNQVYTHPMVAEFITASTTDQQKIPGYFGITGRTIKKEHVRFMWANNSRPVVQPIDGASDPRAGQKGFLTEANARLLVEYTPEPLYSSYNIFNVNKVEYWAQKLQDHLPLGVKLWRVCNAGGGEDERAGVGKLYKIFFVKLRDTPEALRLRWWCRLCEPWGQVVRCTEQFARLEWIAGSFK
ncbi:hypothetical protein JKP88DRAFT_254067 [Tribonema minus]|uniref:Uncharacterized protein n=1 Tax=Tribonema minus TaxID=303371 RepID=A0A835Z5D2_9STRA|nr:hypothetical protein JKP88DRAFT_254067 [Tribonema minus]